MLCGCQVAVDEGGLLRGHKQRLKAEALMRCQADIRARNEAAMKRAAEREAAAQSVRAVSPPSHACSNHL